jgi:hypothetical protein
LKLKLVYGQQTQWAILSSEYQLLPHGVPNAPQMLSVPNPLPIDILLNLHQYFTFDKPGSYSLSVIYTWKEDETWYSPQYSFIITPPNGEALGIVPNESAGQGFQGLYWLETDGDIAKVLYKPWRLQDKKLTLTGAILTASLPAGAQVTLSSQPAGDPLPDRWLIGLANDNLYASFISEDEEFSLATIGVKLPHTMTLVTPALAELAPDEDRPACSIGLIASEGQRNVFNLLFVSAEGHFSPYSPVILPASPVASWALSTEQGNRLFYFLIRQENSSYLYRITCPRNQPCSRAEKIMAIQGDFIQGDLRLLADGQIAMGMIVNLQDEWMRIDLRGEADQGMDVMSQQKLKKTSGNSIPKLLKIDHSGLIHTLYTDKLMLHYIPPSAQTSQWHNSNISNNLSLLELVILASNKVKLLHYHATRGLLVEEL